MSTPSALEMLASEALTRAGFVGDKTSLVVAASGGPDSTALLRCLYGLSNRHNLSLHVAHLNHDFRGAEADHDAAFVQLLATNLGLPCSIDKQDPIAFQRQRGISSFEQAAREMRYSFLKFVAASAGAKAVALGHTADDQAETILLHLLRGSGLHGLRGMSELAAWPWPEPEAAPLLFRPLLMAAKADTAAYCKSVGQTYRQDSGNYMWRFTRNRVRLDLMPRLARDYNSRVGQALVRLARAASEDLDFIEREVERHWPTVASEGGGSVTIDTDALLGLHPSLRRHTLRRAYAIIAGDARGFGDVHIYALLSLAQRNEGSKVLHLPRGIIARREYNSLTLGQADSTPMPVLTEEHVIRLPLEIGDRLEVELEDWRLSMAVIGPDQPLPSPGAAEAQYSACLDLEAVGTVAAIRTRRPGDRFQPSGMAGTKKLQDFFTDAKIPRESRDHIPLLVCNGRVAWVAGRRVAEWAMPKEGAASLFLTFSPTEETA